MTYARHSRLLSSEGSLVCHTCCDTGHPFIMVISEDLWHSHLLHVAVELSVHLFTTKVCRGCNSNTQPFASGENAQAHCATAAVCSIISSRLIKCNWLKIQFIWRFENVSRSILVILILFSYSKIKFCSLLMFCNRSWKTMADE